MIKIKLNRGYVELNWKKPDLSQVLIPSDTNPIYKKIEHATNMNPNPRSQGKFKSSSNSDIENVHLKFSQSKQPKLYYNFNLKDNDKQTTKVIKKKCLNQLSEDKLIDYKGWHMVNQVTQRENFLYFINHPWLFQVT